MIYINGAELAAWLNKLQAVISTMSTYYMVSLVIFSILAVSYRSIVNGNCTNQCSRITLTSGKVIALTTIHFGVYMFATTLFISEIARVFSMASANGVVGVNLVLLAATLYNAIAGVFMLLTKYPYRAYIVSVIGVGVNTFALVAALITNAV